jgi:hypothetical protein
VNVKCKNVVGIKTTPIKQTLSQNVADFSEPAMIMKIENILHQAMAKE